MNKFKVKDRVKIKEKSRYSYQSKAVGTVKSIDRDGWLSVTFDDGSKNKYQPRDLVLVSHAPKRTNFLLQYELDKAPIEEFESIEEVEKRIKELSKDETLREDSIVLYDVSRVRNITLKREVVIEGL